MLAVSEDRGAAQLMGCLLYTSCVKLINEEDYLALRLFDFVQHGFQSFLELAAVFCTCHKRAHIKGEYRLIFKSVRYVSADYTLCKAFGNCGFTDRCV